MPASGKSVLLRKLKKMYPYAAIDTDKRIEKTYNRPISEIFRKQGEKVFRKRERKILLKILASPGPKIIATGGGLPAYRDNWKLLRKYGKVFWLVVPEKTLVKRLFFKARKRPMFRNKNYKHVKAKTRKLLRERRKFYKTADFYLCRFEVTHDLFRSFF